MGQLREVLLSKPNYSNFDLSRTNHFTAAVGPLYPVAVEECLPGDTHTVRLIGDVKTYPLLSPLLGSFKQQVCCFFIPTRLYTQAMDQNKLMFEPKNIYFPQFTMPLDTSNVATTIKASRVKPSSILDCLGVYAGSLQVSPNTSASPTFLNATPLYGYYDIFRNYFCNTQENNFYIVGNIDPWGNLSEKEFQAIPLSGLDIVMQYAVTNAGSKFEQAWSAAYSSSIVNATNPVNQSLRGPLGGLVLRTHNPDMLNAWLSNGTYSSMVSGSSISTAGNSFTINQLRFGSHLLEYYERGLVAGGRYDDWVESQFGVKTNKNLCIPELLGVVSSPIVFDDVVQTSSWQDTPEGEPSPLGNLAGRGRSDLSSRNFRFTCTEHGYIMFVYSIIPNVSYCSGIRPFFLKTRFTDIYSPAMQRLGFQPLMKYNFDAQPVLNGDEGGVSDFFTAAVGYQPAWTEYMTALSEAHGQFNAALGQLPYWVITRNYNPTLADDALDITTYILPTQFSYPFADQSPLAENFLISLGFDWMARRPIGKAVMPTLA